MNPRLAQLAFKKEALVARAALQRDRIEAALQPWRRPLAVADKAVEAYGFLKRHPALVAALVAALVIWRPRRLLRWTSKGWVVWRASRGIRAAAARLVAR